MIVIFYNNNLDGKVAAHHYRRIKHKDDEVKYIPFFRMPALNDYNLKEDDIIIILGAQEHIETDLNTKQISHNFIESNNLSTSGLVYSLTGLKYLPKYITYIANKELKLGKFRESEAFCIQLENILRSCKIPEHRILDELYDDPDGEAFQYLMTTGEANYDQYLDMIKLNAERAYIALLENGLKIGVLNTRTYIADIADYLLKVKNCDAAILWYMDKKDSIVFQLRSLGAIDVSEIARMYTGDGYRNAAGFTVPFRIGTVILENMIGIAKDKKREIKLDNITETELERILKILGVPSLE